jgi:hypothetical protein
MVANSGFRFRPAALAFDWGGEWGAGTKAVTGPRWNALGNVEEMPGMPIEADRLENGDRLVFRLGGPSSIRPAPVIIGISDGSHTEIKDGLRKDDRIVVSEIRRSPRPASNPFLPGVRPLPGPMPP